MLMCRPQSAYGADGPWGQVSYGSTILGYTGPNPYNAQCPAGEIIIGLQTAAASLGGFTFLQVGGALQTLVSPTVLCAPH